MFRLCHNFGRHEPCLSFSCCAVLFLIYWCVGVGDGLIHCVELIAHMTS